MPRRALLTGLTGQDGWYLTDHLLSSGYDVFGLVRPGDVAPAPPGATVVEGDLVDGSTLREALKAAEPHEVYNLAGISSVAMSWTEPVVTAEVNGLGALRLIEAVRDHCQASGEQVRIVQASSAEIFGHAAAPQDESTPIAPITPYGATKAFAHHLVSVYRSAGVSVSSAILFNHESARRPPTFVTRRITQFAARVAGGATDRLRLGNLDARRDWGWAGDYARAMHLIAQHPEPDDFVIATGISRSVGDFVAAAFAHVGVTEWREHVEIDPALVRPSDPGEQRGNAAKAHTVLGWRPSVTFAEMVGEMVDADLGGRPIDR